MSGEREHPRPIGSHADPVDNAILRLPLTAHAVAVPVLALVTAYLSFMSSAVHLSPDRLHRLLHEAVAVAEHPAVFRITGPGAVDCLQGLHTNDLVKPGVDRLVYGALLTQKGMILSDAWVVRLRDSLL